MRNPVHYTLVIRDFRYALRLFSHSPAFALVCVGTLALGIGANTAIFSVANALLLRPLAYRQPDSLVLIAAERKDGVSRLGPLSYPRLQQVGAHNRSFAAVAGVAAEAFNITRW